LCSTEPQGLPARSAIGAVVAMDLRAVSKKETKQKVADLNRHGRVAN
jgi:hypothetical protein